MTSLLDPPVLVEAALGEVASAVSRLHDVVAGGSAGTLAHGELTELIAGARSLQAQLESVTLTAVGEVDARGSYVGDGALTTASWLRRTTRCTHGAATDGVRAARVLRSGVLPETAATLARGEVSARHVEVLAKGVVDAPAEAVALLEPLALATARQADVASLSGLMRQFQHAMDPDGADERAMRRYERRGLTMTPTRDGSFAIHGTADEVNGALIATALDAAAPLVPGDKRTAAQRRLDALADLARRFLASPEAPRVGGLPAQLLVTMDADTLSWGSPLGAPGSSRDEHSSSRSPGATLGWLGHIGGSTARRLACNCDITTVAIDEAGSVVGSRQERRFFTVAQRRAMIARDGDRCVWPWCDRPVAWCDAHHLDSWAPGGSTNTANGALLCEGHHMLLHEGHWSLQRLSDGRYAARSPSGLVAGPEPDPPGHCRPAPRAGPPDSASAPPVPDL